MSVLVPVSCKSHIYDIFYLRIKFIVQQTIRVARKATHTLLFVIIHNLYGLILLIFLVLTSKTSL